MNTALLILGLLIVATGLEAGGDAVIRTALQSSSIQQRIILLALGGVMLFGYGTFLTSAPVDFGKLLGIYVVVFFVMAQVSISSPSNRGRLYPLLSVVRSL
jgi:hypothetical protein